MRVIVFLRQKPKPVLLVERHRIQVRIDRQGPASCLVFDNEHRLDVIQYSRSNLLSLNSLFHTKTAQLYGGIAFQSLLVRKAPFLAEAVELGLVLEIGYRDLVIGEKSFKSRSPQSKRSIALAGRSLIKSRWLLSIPF